MEAIELLQSILQLYGPILRLIRTEFLLTGLCIVCNALFDIVAASSPNKKYLGSNMKDPSTVGGVLKLLIGGAFASLGYDGYLIGAFGSSLFGGNGGTLVSIESYLPNAGANDLGAYIMVAVIGFTQICGICAFGRGLYGFTERIDNNGQSTYRKAGFLCLAGIFCFYIEDLHSILINTFGTAFGGTFFSIF